MIKKLLPILFCISLLIPFSTYADDIVVGSGVLSGSSTYEEMAFEDGSTLDSGNAFLHTTEDEDVITSEDGRPLLSIGVTTLQGYEHHDEHVMFFLAENDSFIQSENAEPLLLWNVEIEQATPVGDIISSSSAPPDATYITQTPNGDLSAEQALNALSDGLLKHTSGVISQAVAETDYVTPTGTVTLTNKTLDDDTNDIHANATYAKVRNVSGSTLTAGTPVYASGYNAGQDRTEIDPADANVVGTMPAMGIVEEDILNNANGHVIQIGIVENINTTGTPVSESWSVGDMLYVSTDVGALTNARPSINGDLVQYIATVTRSHATLGRMLVHGSGRANDIPNNLTMVNTGAYRTGITAADTALLTAYDVNGTSYTTFATLTANNEPTMDLETSVTIGGNAIQSQALARISGSTFFTVQHLQDVFHSSGWVSGGEVADDADGTITVALGTGLIRATDSAVAEILFTDWAAESGANVNLADNDISWVYVEYNAGSSQVVATTTERTDFNRNILLAVIQRTGTTLHINETDKHIVGDHANSMIRRLKETLPYGHVSGGIIGETGTRNITVTAGSFWRGLTEFTTAALDTSAAGTFSYWYNDGSWQEIASQTQIDNTQYNNFGVGLATLSNNKYGLAWGYLEADDDNVAIVYGIGDYTLIEAQDVQSPSSLPEHLTIEGIRSFKIIIKKSDSVFAQRENLYASQSQGSLASDHGNQSGLADVADHTYALLIDGTRALAGAWDMGSQATTNVNIDSGVITGITDLAITDGGTGSGTAQTAIDLLSDVSGATNEHVLTKDTGTGNAIWKVTGAAGSGAFSDGTDPIVQNTTTKDVHVGDGAGTLDGKFEIGGDADQPQLVIEGHSTQTDSLVVAQNDADAEVATIDVTGLITTLVGFDAIGAVDMDYGSADVTDHTFVTDGTGTAEVVLPEGSIDSTEILDATIAIGDLANGTDGELLTWNSSGVATTVLVGTSGHILTSNGTGAEPTMQALTENVQLIIFNPTVDMATGDGILGFHIPPSMNGMDLIYVHAEVTTAGTTGTCDIQVRNATQAADMLSTKLTVDSAETGSDTAATPAVIDTANDDVTTNDFIKIDIDAVHTTAAKGLNITSAFELP